MRAHMQWQWVEHKAPVGGPGLHVSHRGFSVAFLQRQLVVKGPSPQQSGFTAAHKHKWNKSEG